MFKTKLEQKLNISVRDRMDQFGTPGVALAVVYDDEVVYSHGFGVTSTDPEQAVAVTAKTLFRIGSTTKPLTGTLLMRLVEAGQLSLDEPVVTHLPWFTLSDPEATSRVTLRHLMSHQSGLPWGAQFFGHREPSGLETYVREQVPRLPLVAPPGVLFSYSNIGVNVAGCVAEAVGGAPFADLMQSWVFDPLAMERTTFDPLRAICFPLAQAHERTDSRTEVKRGEPWAENVAYYPSAMAYSTVLDIANFARLHLNRGKQDGRQLLAEESVAEMQRTQVDEYQTDGRTVGLSFALTHYRGFRRVGHGGGIASFGSVFTMLPDIGVAVVLQFNQSGFWQAAEEIVSHIFDAALEHRPLSLVPPIVPKSAPALPAAAGPTEWKCFVGTFLGPLSGIVVLSAAEGGNALTLWRKPARGITMLTPLRPDLYTGRNISTGEEEVVGFIKPEKGDEDGLVTYILLNGAPCVRIEPNPSFLADPNAWDIYTGDYEGPDEVSPSGFDVLRLRCESNILKVYSRNRVREEEAVPWDSDCFVYRGRFLRFHSYDSETIATSFSLGDPVNIYERLGS